MASINFVTAHDGFTLRDLVSYNEKHNEANGEDSNDGESHNRSWNHGAEGPTDDPEILAERAKAQRNFLATLLLSQGVPMILHGDELGRTQNGNNNTYAQDNEISWVHWDEADKPLVEFTAAVAQAAAGAPDVPAPPLLHRQHRPHRRRRSGSTTSSGCTSTATRWSRTTGRAAPQALGMYLNGDGIAGKDARGGPISDDHFLLYFNADGDAQVTLPPEEFAQAWDVVIDTSGVADTTTTLAAGSTFGLVSRSVVVLQEHAEPVAEADHSVAASVAALTQPSSTPAADQRSGARPTKDPDRLSMRTPRAPTGCRSRRSSTCTPRVPALPYLHDLGVDWVYLSPLLQATAGSSHGYDVVDPSRVDASRGGA